MPLNQSHVILSVINPTEVGSAWKGGKAISGNGN